MLFNDRARALCVAASLPTEERESIHRTVNLGHPVNNRDAAIALCVATGLRNAADAAAIRRYAYAH